MSALASFIRDSESSIDDPHAIAARLAQLLQLDGWLAPEHQVGIPVDDPEPLVAAA